MVNQPDGHFNTSQWITLMQHGLHFAMLKLNIRKVRNRRWGSPPGVRPTLNWKNRGYSIDKSIFGNIGISYPPGMCGSDKTGAGFPERAVAVRGDTTIKFPSSPELYAFGGGGKLHRSLMLNTKFGKNCFESFSKF